MQRPLLPPGKGLSGLRQTTLRRTGRSPQVRRTIFTPCRHLVPSQLLADCNTHSCGTALPCGLVQHVFSPPARINFLAQQLCRGSAAGLKRSLLSRALDKAHSERLVHKLDSFTDENRAAQATVRELIWNFYRDLNVSSPPNSVRPHCGRGSTASSLARPDSSCSTGCSRGSMPTNPNC
jgi:hypothetical protein